MQGFREIGRRLSNWGRWGAGDQIFLSTAPPLKVVNGVGSPITPLAIK